MAPSLESQQQLPLQEEIASENINNNVVAHHQPEDESSTKSKVAVVGSGNWGSVASKLIASNTLKIPSFHGLCHSFSFFFFFFISFACIYNEIGMQLSFEILGSFA